MPISACFPTLPNLSSRKSKKSFFKKMKLSNKLKTSCENFSIKFLEVNNSWNYLQYFAKEVQQNFIKEFLVNKRKWFNTISDKKNQHSSLESTTLLSMQEQSQDLSLLLLHSLDCLIFLSLRICWFCIMIVFFWVYSSVLRSLSSNLSVRSSRSCYLWLLVLFLTSWR